MPEEELSRLRERPLEAPADREAIRVLMYRPLMTPMVVRAEQSPVGWDLVAYQGAGSDPDVLRRTHSVLTVELAPVVQHLERAGLRGNTRFHEEPDPPEIDGCFWSVERAAGVAYACGTLHGDAQTERGRDLTAAVVELLRVGGLDWEQAAACR